MNLEEMRDAVYLQLRDAAREFVEPDHIDAWLNEAQRDLAQRVPILVTEADLIAADGAFPKPAGMLQKVSLRVGLDDYLGTAVVNFEVTNEEFWEYKDNGWYRNPPIGRIFGDAIEVYPVPVDGTSATLRYVKVPTPLVDGDNEESDLPEELHDKMVQYAISRALYKEREDALADRYYQDYLSDLPARKNAFGRSAVPLRMRYEEGPFDTADSRHRG